MYRQLYRSMLRIRRLEEEVARVYPSDKIKSPVHLSIGQEAVSVGVCEALEPQDVVFGTYRGHALYLAKGGDMRAMVAELRQYLEENDPQAWEERIGQADATLAEREELLESQKKQLDEWQEKMQTHRFVPRDDDVAVMADEVEKERCQLAQERKKLDDDRRQLEEDEEALMKQMREMEVAMAKERAELARQRTDLQRLHADVKHEMELLQRGDGAIKERMAQFQRRHSDVMRPVDLPRQSPTPAAPYQAPAPPPPSRASQPRQSGVFKRFFGQE